MWSAAALTLIVGAGLTWFSAWRAPITEGDAAAAAGHWSVALERYTAAEAQFNQWPIAQRLFASTHRATLANQLAAHYRLGNLDTVLERADQVPPSAASHYWAGSALFEKSKAEQNADARLALLGRATDEFKAALEQQPDRWDFIYDYELTRRLFDELRKKPKTPPKQLLELLRPQPKEGSKPVKRVG